MVSSSSQPTSPRWAIAVLVGLALLLPLTFIGVRAAIKSNANDVRDWLPAHFAETTQYRWFRDRFGSEEFVVVSWPGCTLDDNRLEELATKLTERSAAVEAEGKSPLFIRISTGSKMFADLSSPRFGLSRSQAIARLKGTMIGPDEKQTCAVVTLSETARLKLRNALTEIRSAAVEVGIPATDVHLGGPAVVNDAIDQSSTQSLVRLAGLAGLVGVFIAWLCFREIRLTLIVFIIAGYSAALSLAFVPLCGVPLNAILITMVPLVYVAAMSGAIHLSNYYRESLQRVGPQAAIGDAVRHAALPLGLATTTTAVGLVSLYYSDLAPIRVFGLFSAAGVLIALAMQVIALPALLRVWPAPKTTVASHQQLADEGLLDSTPLSAGWRWFSGLVLNNHLAFTVLFFLCLAAAGAGLSRTRSSIQIMRLFAPSTPIIGSYDWLESNLGAMVPMEVVIRFDGDNRHTKMERSELVRELHKAVSEIEGVSGCLSAATFTPKMKAQIGTPRTALDNMRLRRTHTHLKEAGYLAGGEDSAEEAWRISLRVTAGEDLDYGLFQQHLKEQVEPLLARESEAGKPGVEAIYTGAVPIIYKARRSLLDGLVLGFGTDVLLVVVAVLLLMRNWSSGMLMLLTSIFPTTMIFGLMGWFGWVVDIGSVMSPCVALGVTIDDAIHFLMCYRRATERGLTQRQALAVAYAGCGQAMVQSWGVIGLGLSVFALSEFTPTFRFGFLTIALLTASLVCNLVFLPALLMGPLGRALAARKSEKKPLPSPLASPITQAEQAGLA